jgi:uncharacterized membrane protein
MNALAYSILIIMLIRHHGKNSLLAKAIGKDRKGNLTLVIYAVGIAASWFNSAISLCLYMLVAVIWFIPDRRIENKLTNMESKGE